MKRLVFVNSPVKVKYVKEFMKLKGIEKYTLLESAKEFREELLVNAADVYIFDFYLDASIIEALMDFYENINTLQVHAESIRVAKAYGRLTNDVFIIPDEVNFFIHFWEAGFCRLDNALICESADKPTLHLRRPDGLIIKTKKMRVDLTQTKVPVICMTNMGERVKTKADQMQVTLRPAGIFAKPEIMVRKQPKLGGKIEQIEQPTYQPVPKPVKQEKPLKPVKSPKPPKPVEIPKPPKPLEEPKKPVPPVIIPEPVPPVAPPLPPEPPVAPPLPPEPVTKPVKPKKPPKEVVVPEEPLAPQVEVNMDGAADKVSIADEFDNRLRLLDKQGHVKRQTADEVDLESLREALTNRTLANKDSPSQPEAQIEEQTPQVEEQRPQVEEQRPQVEAQIEEQVPITESIPESVQEPTLAILPEPDVLPESTPDVAVPEAIEAPSEPITPEPIPEPVVESVVEPVVEPVASEPIPEPEAPHGLTSVAGQPLAPLEEEPTGRFGRKKSKKTKTIEIPSQEPKVKEKKGLFGKKKAKSSLVLTGMDWDIEATDSASAGGYSVRAFKTKIITKIDEYMAANNYITQEDLHTIEAEYNLRLATESKEPRFGELAVEMGYIDTEQYCDIVAGFRNIEILHWKQMQRYEVVVDRFNADSYAKEGFFETTPTEDGRVRVIASVNSDAIDTKIRKYAENCIILYTIDAYILQKLQELK